MAAAACLAGAALAPREAQAQHYRCVDAAGRVSYADQKGPGCVPRTGGASVPATTGTPAPTGGAPAARKPTAPTAPVPPPETAAQARSRCTTTREEYAWLKGPRGEGAPGREARLAQMQKALASCP